MHVIIEAFFDETTFTVSYVVADPQSRECAVIDPVLDFDPASGRTATASADRILDYIDNHGLEPNWILDTHVHADHLSAAAYIKRETGAQTGIGRGVLGTQQTFREIFNLGEDLAVDGSQFDRLLADRDVLPLGSMRISVMHTPGHTADCISYFIGDAAFVGDTLFMPDYGTARTDFPGGDAAELYRSIRKILQLPDATRLFMCHDYKAPGRDEFAWETTVAAERDGNIHIRAGISEREFVRFRRERDAGLAMPRLILPAVQVNIRGGCLPAPEDNGVSYLKLPLNRF
ncbi:MAG: MBL fold metallo-hydrolase [Lysobacterales bacterium]|jgi:glyoxylase-like metal-dependent hydrolase (beta-lactamase superfamily II)